VRTSKPITIEEDNETALILRKKTETAIVKNTESLVGKNI